MFVVSLNRECRPVGVLLGGSGISRIAPQKLPDVGALLKPRTDLDGCRSMPMDFVPLPWEVDHHDWLYHKRVSALVDEAAKDDPELVLKMIEQLKQSGEIAPDELVHIEHIARKWIKISRDNLKKGRR